MQYLASSQDAGGPELTEAEIRDRIANGSATFSDFRDLAALLVSASRSGEAISVYQQALATPLAKMQRATLLVELGWIVHDTKGRHFEASQLAYGALESLAGERQTPEVLFLHGSTNSLLAHSLWSVEREVASRAVHQALESLDQVISENPAFEGAAVANLELARLHLLLGNVKEALRYCDQHREYDVNYREQVSRLTILSEALRLARRYTEAESVVRRALRSLPPNEGPSPLLYFTLGLIQRDSGRSVEARRSLEDAILILQNHSELHADTDFISDIRCHLGDLWYEGADYSNAASQFREVLRLHPEDDTYRRNALLGLGHCAMAMGEHSDASHYYEMVLASPNASKDEKAAAQEGQGRLLRPAIRWLDRMRQRWHR